LDIGFMHNWAAIKDGKSVRRRKEVCWKNQIGQQNYLDEVYARLSRISSTTHKTLNGRTLARAALGPVLQATIVGLVDARMMPESANGRRTSQRSILIKIATLA
jgi:hypothetical protein